VNDRSKPSLRSLQRILQSSAPATLVPWVAGFVALWLLVWPLFAGLSVAVDDIQAVLTPTQTLSGGLWRAWHEPLFRPPIVISRFLADPATRRAPGLVLAQSAALFLALLPALKLSRDRGLPPGLTALFWLFHPAVAVTLWQTDTLSQTLCTAAGLWLFALATGAWRPRFRALWWLLLVLAGLLTKETFLGWVPAALLWDYFRLKRLETTHAIAAAIVLAYIGSRLPIAFGQAESVDLGLSRLAHVPTLALGLLTFGPVHLLRVTGLSSPAWWLSLMAPILHMALLVMGARWSSEATRKALLLWATALLVLAPVFIMAHVSELYLMGPNFLTALSLAECLSALSKRSRRWSQVGTILLALSAFWGLASRSYHFAITWEYSRVLAHQLVEQSTLAPAHRPDAACLVPERGHSVYFVSPLLALCVPCTKAVASERGQSLPQGWESSFDCSKLPKRAVW
jgi:hypothetical protein